MKPVFAVLLYLLALASLASAQAANPPDLATPQEKHLRNVHQLTFGGQNAEADFSADGTNVIFQPSHGDVKSDQISIMNTDSSHQHMVSTGTGRTTSRHFYPDGKKILVST